MEGGQERDSSPDEQRHIIDDDDMEASPTDSADLWLPERNEEDTLCFCACRKGHITATLFEWSQSSVIC